MGGEAITWLDWVSGGASVVGVVGVISGILAALWQYKKFRFERREALYASVRSSLVELQTKMTRPPDLAQRSSMAEAAFTVSNEIRESFPVFSSKSELVAALAKMGESNPEFLVYQVAAALPKSHVWQRVRQEVDDMMRLRGATSETVPLVTEILGDCLDFIGQSVYYSLEFDVYAKWLGATNETTLIDVKLDPDVFAQTLGDLQDPSIETVDDVYRYIARRMIDHSNETLQELGIPTAWAAARVIHETLAPVLYLKPKDFGGYANWDQEEYFRIPPDQDPLSRILLNWRSFRKALEREKQLFPEEIYERPDTPDIVFKRVCVDARRILDTFYSEPRIHQTVEAFPELGVRP